MSTSTATFRPRHSLPFGVWLTIAAVVLCYIVSAIVSVPALTTPKPEGYYGLLTDGFLHGQLHLRVEPDPRLLKLANPYAGAQDIPRLHDATLFNGHYYLYFSPVPALLLYAPWTALVGNFLSDGAGTILFALIGFLAGARLWCRLAQVFLPRLGTGWIAAGVLLYGLGNYTLYPLQSGAVYSVPITCASALLMLAFNALEYTVTRLSTKPNFGALGIASLAWGLAVASRPHYLLSLAGLALAGAMIVWRLARTTGFRRQDLFSVFAAAILPAAVVGGALVLYNFARYKNPLEFGITYQLAAGDLRGIKLAGAENILTNIREYSFTGANYSPYFPFVWVRGELIGVVQWASFALLALLFPLMLFSKRLRADWRWSAMGLSLLVAGLGIFISLCFFLYNNTRYVADFLSPLILCGLLVSGFALQESRSWRAVRRFPLAAGIILLGVSTCVHSLSLSFQQHPDTPIFTFFERIADRPAKAWEAVFGVRQGPVLLKVKFPTLAVGKAEPLVTTSFGRDLIYVKATDAEHVAFGYFHEGSGGPESEPVSVVPGKEYTIECDLGSLYPPRAHPVFDRWDDSLVDALRRRVEVKLDGRTVLHWTSAFYPSQPFETEIGRNHRKVATVSKFSGQILETRRRGMPTQEQALPLAGSGPIRLHIKFPNYVATLGEPLISTGRPGKGDLVYVRYLGPNRLRFGHDSWSYGNVETADITYDPAISHVVDVDLGALRQITSEGASAAALFQLRLDGRLLISVPRPSHPTSAYDLALGFNATGCSSAGGFFTGPMLEAERTNIFSKSADSSPKWGPFNVTTKFPVLQPNLREPLLVTGTTGKGDFIYLAGVDANHLRIGYDHWGVSGAIGNPMEIDPTHPHVIEISMGSLYPSGDDPAWGQTPKPERQDRLTHVRVKIDGQSALDLEGSPYPATRDQIYLSANPIGGSTCAAKYTGEIYAAERLDSLSR